MRLLLALLIVTASGCGAVKRAAVDTVVASRRADAGLAEREATVDGRRVAFLERDGTEPALVLIHGFGAEKDGWLGFVDALPEGRRVLVPDLPGHGGSEAGPGAYGAFRLTDEVAAWLAAVTDGPADLVGNSLGGLVATLVASRAPDGVRRLVLMDPAGVDAPQPSGLDSLLADGANPGGDGGAIPKRDSAANPLIPTTRAEYDDLLDLVFEGDPEIPGPARDVLAASARDRAPFLRDLFANIQGDEGDLLPVMPTVRQPTLVIWGERDRVLSPSAAPIWAESLPDATLVVLPGVGHAPMMEAPAETARLVTGFLPPPTAR